MGGVGGYGVGVALRSVGSCGVDLVTAKHPLLCLSHHLSMHYIMSPAHFLPQRSPLRLLHALYFLSLTCSFPSDIKKARLTSSSHDIVMINMLLIL